MRGNLSKVVLSLFLCLVFLMWLFTGIEFFEAVASGSGEIGVYSDVPPALQMIGYGFMNMVCLIALVRKIPACKWEKSPSGISDNS